MLMLVLGSVEQLAEDAVVQVNNFIRERGLDAVRQVEGLPGFEAFNVFEHVAGVRFDRRLAQPGQLGCCRGVSVDRRGIAAPLANQRQVSLAEGVMPDEFIFGVRWQQ